MTTVFDASSLDATDDGDGESTATFRVIVKAAALSAATGNQAQVSFRSGSSTTTASPAITGAWIGQRSGATLNFTGNQVQLTFGGSSSINFTVANGQTITSDVVTLGETFDNTHDYIVSFRFGSAAGTASTTSGAKTNVDYGFLISSTAGEEALTTATAGYDVTHTSAVQLLRQIFITAAGGGVDRVRSRPHGRRPFRGPRRFFPSFAPNAIVLATGAPCGGMAAADPQRPQYSSSLCNWIVGASLALTALPCGEQAAANPAPAIQRDVSCAPYNTALLTPLPGLPCGDQVAASPVWLVQRDVSCAPCNTALLSSAIIYFPCIVTGWSVSDGPFQPNRDWINTGVPPTAVAPKPFTQVDQSNPRAGPVTSRDWTATISPSLLAKPPPTGWSADQSNPRGPFQPIRDWINQPGALQTPPAGTRPPTSYDWQLPRGPQLVSASWVGQPPPVVAAVVQPPAASCWALPVKLPPFNTSWIQTLPPIAPAVVYLPSVVTGWSVSDGPVQPNRDWVGQPPPAVAAAQPPAASCWTLPVRLPAADASWVARPAPIAVTVAAKPPTAFSWLPPVGPFQPNRDWIQSPRQPTSVAYLPCVVTGWAPPDRPFEPNRDWFGSAPPLQYQFRDPFFAIRLTLQYDRRVHSQDQPNQALTVLSAPPIVRGIPCLVVASAVNDPPPAGQSWIYQPGVLLTPPKVRPTLVSQENPSRVAFWSRDWNQSGALLIPAAARPVSISQENPSRLAFWSRDWIDQPGALLTSPAIRPTLVSQENPSRLAFWSRDWINQPGALLTPPQVRPTLISQENPKGVAATNRDWARANQTLLIAPTPQALKRTFDYPLPRQVPATNRDWINAPSALRTPPKGIRPPIGQYNWPLPVRLVALDRSWIKQGGHLPPPAVVVPPATEGGGGLGFSYQRYERLLEELYKKKKKLPPKAKKALAKAIVVIEEVIDTRAEDLARLERLLEAITSARNTSAQIAAINATAEQARSTLEQERLRRLREEDDLILLMLDEDD